MAARRAAGYDSSIPDRTSQKGLRDNCPIWGIDRAKWDSYPAGMAFTPDGDIEILQGLHVFDVSVDEDELVVDLYGGDESVFGTVRFSFPDLGERRRRQGALESWRDNALPVTFVTSGEVVTLVSEHELLADAFAGSSSPDA